MTQAEMLVKIGLESEIALLSRFAIGSYYLQNWLQRYFLASARTLVSKCDDVMREPGK